MSTNAHRQRAALFDLDGVLIDSEGVYTRFWGDIGRRYVPGEPDFAAIIKGSTLVRILGDWFPDPAVRDLVVEELRIFEAEMTYDPFPGALSLIDDLHHHNIPVAIVTSSGPRKMQCLASRQPALIEAVDTIISAGDVTHSKPHPEGYLLGAARLGVQPADCFVFEDSLSGLAAGRASGATVIGIATTLPSDRIQGRADLIVDSIADITVDTLLHLFP